MSDMMTEDQKREDAIRKLWELKLAFEKQFSDKGKTLKFDHMLKNEKYRNNVLSTISQLKQKNLTSMASGILAMDLPGSLYHKKNPGISNHESNKEQIRELLAQFKEKEQRFLNKLFVWKLVTALVFIGFLLSSGLHAYQWYEISRDRIIYVEDAITEDTNWYANNTYILTKIIYVEGGANLTIEAGTQIYGETGSALVVTQDAQIFAKGSESAPIVFSSNKAIGERDRGDWGGLVLLGSAPANIDNAHIEGVSENDSRGYFGGKDKLSSCGVLEYVRIEFAGFEIYQDNELNGLTLGGCGSNTIVRNIQVHRSLDDGIEVFGGNVNLKNIVITGPGDDGFDWDMGWQGNVQFLIVQLHHDGGDNAFEGDSHGEYPDITPRSKPVFYNVSLIGANSKQIAQRAILLREGSAGQYFNLLVSGFSKEAVDFRGDGVSQLTANGLLNFGNSLFYDIADNVFFPDEEDDDAGFDEEGFFNSPDKQIRFGLDPRFPADVYNVFEPNFSPFINSPALEYTAALPQGEFWDEGANYIGAIRPGVATSWIDGWTKFPAN